MSSLSGKKVLFIAPQFFGYEKEIELAMVAQGATVEYIPDRPFTSPLLKAIARVRKEWIQPLSDLFFKKKFNSYKNNCFDIVFVIIGEAMSPKTLALLKQKQTNAEFVLYLWDGLKNKRLLYKNLPYFNRCATFDASDAKTYKMYFRPLFYSNEFSKENCLNIKNTYDLSFIGTIHSDRFKIISNIKNNLPHDFNGYWYLYLQAKWVFFIYKIFNKSFNKALINDFKYIGLDKKNVQNVFL